MDKGMILALVLFVADQAAPTVCAAGKPDPLGAGALFHCAAVNVQGFRPSPPVGTLDGLSTAEARSGGLRAFRRGKLSAPCSTGSPTGGTASRSGGSSTSARSGCPP